MGTSVPTPTFGANGFSAPDEATQILPAVQNDLNAAFGGGLNPSLETPQGQLASTIAALIGNVNDTFLEFCNQSDPAFASGRMQDAIGRIYFIERLGAEPTVVVGRCYGATGLTIPSGSVALASDGNLYASQTDGTIPTAGYVDISFACNTPGPITCPAGSLDQIYRAIPGWDSITNPADGVIGRDTETRAQFEERRALSVAQNANGSLPAILGAILNVSGVIDAVVVENVENTSQTIGGVSLQPNSIYCAVVGGAAADVAQAIWSRKSPGCGYNGNTTVIVYDENAAYSPPYPAYSVLFEVPDSMTVIFAVNLKNSNLVPSDVQTQVQNAIISAFAGEDGGPRARIGTELFASRFYSTIAALGSWAQIISIKVGCQNDASAQFTATISGTAMTVSAVASGTIAIGQTVLGPNLLPGTTITAGSGTAWTISPTQTISAPQTMYGCLANLDDLQPTLAQAPVVSANDIVVTLT